MTSTMDLSVISLSIMLLTLLGVLGLLLNAVLAVFAAKTGKAVTAARALSVLLLVCTLLPILLGYIGTAYDLHLMEQALVMHMLSAEESLSLRATATSTAMVPKMMGLCSSMTCMLPAALLCVYTAGRRAPSLTGADEPPSAG